MLMKNVITVTVYVAMQYIHSMNFDNNLFESLEEFKYLGKA
jgi:hypothetical protein